MTAPRPDRYMLAPGLEISRVVTGLWQVADMERDGRSLDPERARPTRWRPTPGDGFDTFDMADHYGSAEVIAGRFLAPRGTAGVRPAAFTKWCPAPGADDAARSCARGRASAWRGSASTTIDLLQLHWWSFEHPGYLDAMRELAALREEGADPRISASPISTPIICASSSGKAFRSPRTRSRSRSSTGAPPKT